MTVKLTTEQQFQLAQIQSRLRSQSTEDIKTELNGLMRMLMLRQSAAQAEIRVRWGIGSPRHPER